MLFKQREAPSLLSRLRTAAWPRRSWGRSFRYYAMRVLRLSGSPQSIAIGVAAGVFASFTPFIGLHFIFGFIIAWVLGGNLIAAALGTAAGNPFTFPFIWASTHRLGRFILGLEDVGARPIKVSGAWAERSFDALVPIFGPMIVGAIPLGAVTAVIFYVSVLYSVRGFQRMRAERLALRRERLQQIDGEEDR
ncbi:MAG: DUF2062 domain-containing protein [Alphaproteobacteria bacterium]